MSETEFVRVRECPDGTHEEGDGVWISTRPSLECGIAARQDVASAYAEAGDDESALDQALIRRWFGTYARLAPVSWNLHDETGEWPFDTSRLVEDFDLGYPVADRADDLYREVVMRPLAQTPPKRSRNGATGGSTSATTTSTGSRRARSSRHASGGPQSLARTA